MSFSPAFEFTKTPQIEDQSYMDYMMAVRNFAIRDWFPGLAGEISAQAEAAELPPVVTVDEYQQLAPALETNPINAWKRVMRSQQQMTWRRLQDSYGRNQEYWQQRLDQAEEKKPGRLHFDANFEVPESACLDIHLQPGGYCRDPLAGFLFEHGTRVFYQGDGDRDELHESYAEMMRAPVDGKVEKILDLGCSIGQGTTALKQQHSGAEVWGLDVGLPLLKYAHMRATEMNVDVHFKQGLAEDLDFADGSFDSVFAYILFHEVPEHTIAPIVEEAFRVLRPGGTLTVIDAPWGDRMPSANRMWLAFDARYNCEPYSPAFVATDFVSVVEKAGFDEIEHGPTPTFLSRVAASKPT